MELINKWRPLTNPLTTLTNHVPLRTCILPFIDPITKSKIQMVKADDLRTKMLTLVRILTHPIELLSDRRSNAISYPSRKFNVTSPPQSYV